MWFQNRRCREKQRKEASRLQSVNRKLSAMNKLLMEEEDRLLKKVSHLVYENSYFRQHTPNALRHLRQIAQDVSQPNTTNMGRHPAALRALSHRLSRGFNEALNGFSDEGWLLIGNDGMDDVTILVNSNPDKLMGSNISFSIFNAVLCANASMLLRNMPPAILLGFLCEHRSECADNNIDAYSAAAIKMGPCTLLGPRVGNFGCQVILPLAQTIEHEELPEVIKLEGVGHSPEVVMLPRDVFLLKLSD